MQTIHQEILSFIKDNDVKFIRLSFCDVFGTHKNIAILQDELKNAFTEGVPFDAYAVHGYSDTDTDLRLFPDPDTLTVLPWRPGSGRVARFYCTIKDASGQPITNDSRAILKEISKSCLKKGYEVNIGTECEFYLFKTDVNGMPSLEPHDNGGYGDIAPLDGAENIRREIVISLEEMGLKPHTSHHQEGPGQNEIDFYGAAPLTSADNLQTFKSVVKAVAARNGLFASFMPKPLLDQPGNALHINLRLKHKGEPLFMNIADKDPNDAQYFLAGVLNRIPDMTLFLNPTANSYERWGKFDAPQFVSYSPQNRSQLTSMLFHGTKKARMELRSPDPATNPYLAFALIIAAGIEGIEKKIKPIVPIQINTIEDAINAKLVQLPETLSKAIQLAKESEFINKTLPASLIDTYINIKTIEAQEAKATRDKAAYYKKKHFYVI
ncbi:MAG: glutamine synthetase family protein [Firmicutes bacterium]|nr:glutamine synthetase family protein [Bacillota bacterium]